MKKKNTSKKMMPGQPLRGGGAHDVAPPGVQFVVPPRGQGLAFGAAEESMKELQRLMAQRQPANLAEAKAIMDEVMQSGRPIASFLDEEEELTPAMQAHELVSLATGAPPRLAFKLARRALEIWPDCADAYTVLASISPDEVEAEKIYQQAVSVGERVVRAEYGDDAFESHAGMFWGLLETRPYMRALQAQAELYWEMDRPQEAIAAWQTMLRLNPNDNQGVRELLLGALIQHKHYDRAEDLLVAYKGDSSACWAFDRALLDFITNKRGAKNNLLVAHRKNRHIVLFLTSVKMPPAELSEYITEGEESEAAEYVGTNGGAWLAHPDALEWLMRSFKREIGKYIEEHGWPGDDDEDDDDQVL